MSEIILLIGALTVGPLYLLALGKCVQWRSERVAAIAAKAEVMVAKNEATASFEALRAEGEKVRSWTKKWIAALEESEALYRYGAIEESTAVLREVFNEAENQT